MADQSEHDAGDQVDAGAASLGDAQAANPEPDPEMLLDEDEDPPPPQGTGPSDVLRDA
jgi:hypothetical protein